MYALHGKYIFERGLLMEKIITKLYELIKSTSNLMELEENVKMYMYDVFASLLGDVFTQLDQVIKTQKQQEGWTVVRDDDKTVQFTFGGVTFRHTSMRDEGGGNGQ